ncbi:MAG: metal ABC transporter substrate-binding protein [Dehalococcoidia bacterium]
MRFRYAGIAATVAVGLGLLLGACGGDSSDDVETGPVGAGLAGTRNELKSDDRLRVATTVAPITSLLLQIGGDRIYIHGLIPPGIDSHTYEPKPSDAVILGRADIFIMNGASLEGTTEAIARSNLKDPSKIYKLADNTLSGDDPATGFLYDFSFPRAEGKPNPHLWMNPLYALRYAELMRDWLSENDPDNASYYSANYDAFQAVIDQLHAAIEKDSQTVPPANRKLLTYHDSWAYWARLYGYTVVGAAQPSDFKEPSAKEVADLIKQVRDEGVPVVFGSEVFPSGVLETIAKESGAEFEEKLSDDEPPGDVDAENHTYVGMLVENMRIMLTRLGGNADTVAEVPIANTFGK